LSSARRRGSALVCVEPARAPLERRVGGSAVRWDLRTTITTNTLRGPRCARLSPARRSGPYLRTGCARWMATRTPWRSEERRRAGSRPAQRRRTRAHAAETRAPPGAVTPAERSSWRSRSRDPRRPHPAFLEEIPELSLGTAVGWFSNCRPPGGRSPGSSFPVALRICQSRSPASTSCNHLSLAEPRRPRVRDDEAPWWRAAGGRSPWPTGSISTPPPVRQQRVRGWREWVDPSHEHPSSRAWLPSRRRPRWLACDAPRAPTPCPRVAHRWTLQRRARDHQDHLRSACPAKGATVLVIRGAIRRFTRPRPGSRRRRDGSRTTT